MKQHLLVASLLLAASSAQAQVRYSIGPQLGYTLATTDYKVTNSSISTYDTNYRSGFSGGIVGELGVGHLVVRPAVLYAQKGYNQEQSGYLTLGGANGGVSIMGTSSNRTRIDYLVTPLNIGYTQHSDGQGIQAFAGAYFGFVLGGHYTNEVTYSSNNASGTRQENFSGDMASSTSNRPASVSATSTTYVRGRDFGVQGGIGYRHQSLLAQLEYSVGLKNVDPNNSSSSFSGSDAYYNRVFQLSLAYLFGSKS